MRQPMPLPTDAELAEYPVYSELVRNALKLNLHHDREVFAELQTRFDIADKDIPTTPKQVDMLKIRNDVLVAGKYGIQSAEMAHMLKGFKVLAKKRPEYMQALMAAMGQV